MKNLLKNQKQIYLNQINDQNDIIQKLESECNYLIEISENIIKEHRKKEIQEKLKNYEIAQKKWNTVQNLKINQNKKNINHTKNKIIKSDKDKCNNSQGKTTIEKFYGEIEK